MANKTSVSVALCTYNGAPYVHDLLESIAAQSRPPDQMVVCDDGSSDNTVAIVERFAALAPFAVRVFVNEQNVGAARNFERAIERCDGELIAPADQDDVWRPEKLEKLAAALEADSGAGYAFCNAEAVDEHLRPLGYSIWQSVGFTGPRRLRFQSGEALAVLLRSNVVTGAAMVFRSSLRGLIWPMPDITWYHDYWIALLASATEARGVLVEESLVQYRVHPEQLTATGRRPVTFRLHTPRARAEEKAEQSNYGQALNRLASTGVLTAQAELMFIAKMAHLQVRQEINEQPRLGCLGRVLRELLSGGYHRFSYGWRSAAGDLLHSRRAH